MIDPPKTLDELLIQEFDLNWNMENPFPPDEVDDYQLYLKIWDLAFDAGYNSALLTK
jgi:hypothetical protein